MCCNNISLISALTVPTWHLSLDFVAPWLVRWLSKVRYACTIHCSVNRIEHGRRTARNHSNSIVWFLSFYVFTTSFKIWSAFIHDEIPSIQLQWALIKYQYQKNEEQKQNCTLPKSKKLSSAFLESKNCSTISTGYGEYDWEVLDQDM